MRFRPTYRNIWGISLPIIIIGISESVVDITDTIFLAHYGVTELAAIGLADAIYGLALFLTLGLVDGIQIIIGRRAGQERYKAIGEVFNQGAYLLLIVSTLMILFIIFIVPLITLPLLSSNEIHDAVSRYLNITAYALIFQGINLALSAFYVGISKTRVLIGAALILLTSNITLDYIFIFGHFGAPELGIKGAAIASLTAEIFTFIFLAAHIIIRRYTAIYGLFHFTQWNQALTKHLLSISWPVSLDALIDMTKWLLLIIIIEKMGEHVLASANIIFSCYALFLIPVESFSETVCSMASNLIGQQQNKRLQLLIHRSIKLSYFIITPFIVITLLFPDYIVSIFTLDYLLIENSLNGLSVIALVTLVAIPAHVYYSAIAGTGDTRVTLLIQSIATIITLSYAWHTVFSLSLALEFVLLAELISWLLIGLLSWMWFRSGYWSRLDI